MAARVNVNDGLVVTASARERSGQRWWYTRRVEGKMSKRAGDATGWRDEWAGKVCTPEDFVRFVDAVGCCTRSSLVAYPDFPNQGELIGTIPPGTSDPWFWKDDLHIEKKLYYGQILGAGVAALVSLEMLPHLIAAQGDNDARTLYEQNRLPHLSLQVYEHIERNGVTPSNQLPTSSKDRSKALVPLQQRFLLTKHDLTGRTRGTYGYKWGLREEHFPDAFGSAAKLSVAKARETVLNHLQEKHGVVLNEKQTARIFHWNPL